MYKLVRKSSALGGYEERLLEENERTKKVYAGNTRISTLQK
jgi:hypothetical protein